MLTDYLCFGASFLLSQLINVSVETFQLHNEYFNDIFKSLNFILSKFTRNKTVLNQDETIFTKPVSLVLYLLFYSALKAAQTMFRKS